MTAPKLDRWYAQQLQATWPDASCELHWRDHWQLLVAVICSARASDDRVNLVLADFWPHYPRRADLASADPDEVGQHLRRLPLWRQKARAIVEAAWQLGERHDGVVPSDPHQLQALPGVGRKTAAVVAGNGFGVPTIAADSHVQRVLSRWGWAREQDVRGCEAAIAQRWPADDWVVRCHQLIRLGRHWCRPKRPWCSRCVCRQLCPALLVQDAR